METELPVKLLETMNRIRNLISPGESSLTTNKKINSNSSLNINGHKRQKNQSCEL